MDDPQLKSQVIFNQNSLTHWQKNGLFFSHSFFQKFETKKLTTDDDDSITTKELRRIRKVNLVDEKLFVIMWYT